MPILFLLFVPLILLSQNLQDSDTIKSIKNAEYLKDDLTKYLQTNLKYPKEAVEANLQGDVILAFKIDKNGKSDSLNIISSPSKILSYSSSISFNQLEDKWSPCKVNGNPIDKIYMLVIRYRMWLNTHPPEYMKKAEKFVEKQKYDKALEYYNLAIKENKYDYKQFESRSKLEKILSNIGSAKEDSLQAIRLKNEIISVVDINAIGVTSVKKINTGI